MRNGLRRSTAPHEPAKSVHALRCWPRSTWPPRAQPAPHPRFAAAAHALCRGRQGGRLRARPPAGRRQAHACGADLFGWRTSPRPPAAGAWTGLAHPPPEPLLPDEDRFVAEYDVAVTVSTEEEVSRLNQAAKAAGRPILVHVKIDTGMDARSVARIRPGARQARLGLASSEAGRSIHALRQSRRPTFTQEQRRRFLAALKACGLVGKRLNGLFVHADNSAGLETMLGASRSTQFGLGSSSSASFPSGLVPLPGEDGAGVQLPHEGRYREAPSAGTTVSYGRTRTLARDSTIAVLCAGYGDGIPRSVSNRASVLIRGVRCPVLGRVTMDQTIVDVTEVGARRAATRPSSWSPGIRRDLHQ